jgi:glucose-1-phosphatase
MARLQHAGCAVTQPVDALLFDLGRVLIDLDAKLALARWAELGGMHAQDFEEGLAAEIGSSEAFRRHERGEISDAAFFAFLRREFGLDLTDEQFIDGWNAIFIGEMPGIRRALSRVDGVLPLYAFSNTNAVHHAYWSVHFADLLTPFRKIYVSNVIGMRKPDAAAFRTVVDDMGVAPERVLFFDDIADNVTGARVCGLQAIQVRSTTDVELALDRLLGAARTARPDTAPDR